MVAVRVNPEPERYLPLFVAAGKEVGLGYEVRPDFARYRALIDAGDYLFIGAEDDGVPVGYVAILVVPLLFNSEVLHAVTESFYVAPAYRRTMVAGRLLKEALAHLNGRVSDVSFDCVPGSWLERSLAKRGFRLVEHSYLKSLEGCKHG